MAKIRQKIDRAEWAKLPQDIQALYVERNGEYVLDSDEAEGLRTAFERTKQEAAEMRRRLEEVRDIDPEEHKRLRDEAAKAAREKEIEKGNYEKLRIQDEEAHKAELRKRDEHALRLQRQLEESLVDGELTRAIASYPGARAKLLMPAARSQVALRDIGGRLRSVVLDEKGEPRLKAGAKSTDEYMEPSDLIAEMRNDKEYAGAFPAAGSGNAPLRAGTGTLSGDPRKARQREEAEHLAQQIRDGATKVG